MECKLNMFEIECEFEVSSPTDASVNLYLATSKEAENHMRIINKEKEYKEYLEQIKQIIKPVEEKLCELTMKFAEDNLSDQGVGKEKENAEERMKEILNEIFNGILGGNE